MLLFGLTSLTDFLGLCTALWLAGYLFSRGFRSPTTLRSVLLLLLLSGSFIEGYISLHEPEKSHYAWYVAANLAAALVWFNLTYQWLPATAQQRQRVLAWAVYVLGLATIMVALLPATGLSGTGPGLTLANADKLAAANSTAYWLQMGFIVANAVFLLLAAATTIFNFRMGSRAGLSSDSNALWFATVLGAAAMVYGVVSFAIGNNLPRLGVDWLVLAALILLGLAVARHQAFVERRTTLQDLPVSVLAIVVIMAFYAFGTQRAGFSAAQTALVTALAVFTHSIYDLAREVLDRWVHRQESELRRQLRRLARDVGGPDIVVENLQNALNSLVRTLQASGGFVAVRQGEHYSVLASVHALPVGQQLEPAALAADDLRPGQDTQLENTAWLAPARANNEQLGAIGLGPRVNRGTYRDEDLDLLAEAADTVGQLLRAEALRDQQEQDLIKMVRVMEEGEVTRQSSVHNLMRAMETPTSDKFERMVEHSLQHLSDTSLLGQSGLAEELLISGATHLERGRAVREALVRGIESLKPTSAAPSGTPPREWYQYTVLYEAYVEDVPNRDIMARLYVSEGTFNRERKKALKAVAQALLENKRPKTVSDHDGVTRADPAANAGA